MDKKIIKHWANEALDALEEFLNESAKGSPEEIGVSAEDLKNIGETYDILGDIIFMMDQKFD